MGQSQSCPLPEGVDDLHHTGTSHNALLITSLACTAVTACSTLALTTMHLLRYNAPKEQRQIVRIAFAPLAFALVSLGQIYNYSVAEYIDPISSFYESICVCALFLLYVQFAAPSSGTFGEELFDAIKAQQEAGTKGKGNWPRSTWVAVFQYPVVEVVSIIVLEATTAAGTYCESSLRPRYGHFWSILLHSVGLVVAFLSILRFYGRMKKLIRARRGLAKLTCFKLIVAVRFIQNWVFSILVDQDVISTSSRFTHGDLTNGLPNALMCVETVLFAASFWYAFTSSEYADKPSARRMPLWRAIVHALNPYDLVHGVVRAATLLTGGGSRSKGSGGVRAPAPLRRVDRGRYKTLNNMESLAMPDRSRSRSRTPLQGDDGEASPPRYDFQDSPGYLSMGVRQESSLSPGMERHAVEERGIV